VKDNPFSAQNRRLSILLKVANPDAAHPPATPAK